MGYNDAKRKIIECVTDNGKIIELNSDRSNEKQYCRILEMFSNYKNLIIKYPGYKTTRTKCDYCVYLADEKSENPVSHIEIMQDLYAKTTVQNYRHMRRYVEAVATEGKDIAIPDLLQESDMGVFSFEELTALMFYIAIQEDINYPETCYDGRKMCFYRYLEAVYCKVNTNHRFDEACDRAVAKRYKPRKWDDVGDLYDVVSAIRR